MCHPMMSHAHSFSSFCLHMSVPPSVSLFLILDINLSRSRCRSIPLRRSTEWGVWLCGQNNLFYRLWAQRDRQLRLLRDLYSDLPEWSRRRRHGPSYSFDAELDDETIGKALSSPLFTQEREESANRRQAYHSHEESLIPAQSFFTRTRTVRPVFEQSSKLS